MYNSECMAIFSIGRPIETEVDEPKERRTFNGEKKTIFFMDYTGGVLFM